MEQNRWNGFFRALGENWLTLALFALVAWAALFGMTQASAGGGQEELHAAEESIRRAAVCCYAIEGAYPASYDYLKENYPVRVDEQRYIVHYQVFASNLMPDITVTEEQP